MLPYGPTLRQKSLFYYQNCHIFLFKSTNFETPSSSIHTQKCLLLNQRSEKNVCIKDDNFLTFFKGAFPHICLLLTLCKVHTKNHPILHWCQKLEKAKERKRNFACGFSLSFLIFLDSWRNWVQKVRRTTTRKAVCGDGKIKN